MALFLNQLIELRSAPDQIIWDNGTDLTSKVMLFWQKDSGVKLALIRSGKPTRNALIKSLNGRLRQECLSQHWFRDLDEIRKISDDWRYHSKH